ncbi:MAG: hypothetical protein ACI9UV_000288 [Algoriphagus sp.]|jgi:hypothetical protein
MKNNISLCILILFTTSCGPQERVSKEVFDAVNDKMEVKKLSDFEIIEEAMVWGDSISIEAQDQLMSNLQKAVAEKGVDGAVEYCNVNATAILDEIADKYGVSIRRVSNRDRNPTDKPNKDEVPLLEAYEYNAENGIKSEPNIQKIENGDVLLYTKAIVIPGVFCLIFQGDSVKEIDSKTLQKIDSIYSNDQAKGHQIGDLRGMWSIRIPKKAVVLRL